MSDEEKMLFARREISRRNMLRGLGLGAVTLGLAACSSSGGDSGGSSAPDTPTTTAAGTTPAGSSTAAGSVAPGAYGEIAIDLSWIPNIEFSGEFYATDKGYYTEAGFTKVTLVAGPPKSSVEDDVSQGTVLVGLSAPNTTAAYNVDNGLSGGDALKIIASTYQKNPFCLLSLKEKTPISTVAELKGKKIGVQSSNLAIVNGFLKANKLTDKDVTIVNLGTDFSTAQLEAGKVDAHTAYLTNEVIQMKDKGLTPVTLGFADNGLPFTAETYTVLQSSIDSKRDLLKALLVAEIKGWSDAVKDPAGSADLAVNKYGKGKLDPSDTVAEQTEEATAQVDLVVTADTKANGLFTVTDDLLQQMLGSLATLGYTVKAEDLFDFSLLTEVYQEHPELIG